MESFLLEAGDVMNRTAMFVLACWVAAAILLPIARLCGLVHWSWWICGAPLGLMVLGIGLLIVLTGLLGEAIEAEFEDESGKQERRKSQKNLSGGVESSRQTRDTHQAGDGQRQPIESATVEDEALRSGSSDPPAQYFERRFTARG